MRVRSSVPHSKWGREGERSSNVLFTLVPSSRLSSLFPVERRLTRKHQPQSKQTIREDYIEKRSVIFPPLVTSLFSVIVSRRGREGDAEKRGEKMGIYFSMVWGLLLGDLAGWQAAASFPPFRSSSSPHPGLGEDIQSISEVGCRIQLQLYLSATWAGRSPDPFRDVRLTSLSSFRLSCLSRFMHPKRERAGLCQVVTAEGIWIVSYTRKGEGKRNFCFASEGEKVPKMGLFVT